MGAVREYSVREEAANYVTHALGAALAIAALVLLLVPAARSGEALRVASFAVYGGTLILLYLASTLYHAWPQGKRKQWLQRLDHAGIFLLIAGTYTPVTVLVLRGGWGWSLFGVVWGVALVGVVIELVHARLERPLLWAYIGLGWIVVLAAPKLWASLPLAGLLWLAAGGACYTGGVVFYLWRRLPFGHAIWHLWVLAGSACHFFLFYRHVV
jgi:hemolysin III